jgi:hypothetical protein
MFTVIVVITTNIQRCTSFHYCDREIIPPSRIGCCMKKSWRAASLHGDWNDEISPTKKGQ